jgi:hypothetical protein
MCRLTLFVVVSRIICGRAQPDVGGAFFVVICASSGDVLVSFIIRADILYQPIKEVPGGLPHFSLRLQINGFRFHLKNRPSDEFFKSYPRKYIFTRTLLPGGYVFQNCIVLLGFYRFGCEFEPEMRPKSGLPPE